MQEVDNLLEGLRARDAAAFKALHDALGQPLYDFAVSLLRNREEARDLVQEAYVVALTSIDRFRGDSSLKTWMFGILVNKARERRRKLGREMPESSLPDEVVARLDGRGHWTEPPKPWEDPGGQLDRAALARAVREEMEHLNETQCAVMRLRDVAGFTTAEVAEMLEISEGNVRVILHRARTEMRQRLDRRFTRSQASATRTEAGPSPRDTRSAGVSRFLLLLPSRLFASARRLLLGAPRRSEGRAAHA